MNDPTRKGTTKQTTQPRFGRLDLAMERVSEGIGKAVGVADGAAA
jgi:hypothetical protein